MSNKISKRNLFVIVISIISVLFYGAITISGWIAVIKLTQCSNEFFILVLTIVIVSSLKTFIFGLLFSLAIWKKNRDFRWFWGIKLFFITSWLLQIALLIWSSIMQFKNVCRNNMSLQLNELFLFFNGVYIFFIGVVGLLVNFRRI